MNLDKSTTEKTSMILDMIIYLFTAIHILSCIWVGIGFITECSWLEKDGGGCNEDNKAVDPEVDQDLYIQAIYWVVTTLTTVGYGDFKGYTSVEYSFQMIVEFLGIGVFSYLMGSINDLVGTESTLQDIIDDRVDDTEQWLRQIEKSRSKNFSKILCDCIKEYTNQSYQYDFYQIQRAEFYDQLKPTIRYKLVSSLFYNFKERDFYYMFKDHEFEAGDEFTCEFVGNIYSRLYLPDTIIVDQGERFEDLSMI